MAVEQAALAGPDLAQGVSSDALAEGAMLLGHADGEAVLLTRVNGACHAVAASCTHYGGPLAEGILVGHELRCPWHHACFDVRTGDATRAPALNPLARWTVEERNGRIIIGHKAEHDPLATVGVPVTATAVRRVVIVGAGAAGCAAAEMLRRIGFDGSIHVVDAEADAPYDRPNLSKDYLAGNAPEAWIPIRPPGFWQEHGIERVRAMATRLDVPARRVELDRGEPLPFDALLLAPGAEPVRLPIPGADLPHVHYLRSLADSRAIIAATASAKRAVVIGASFIGLEVAASLRTRGLHVHVVAPDKLPLERVMGRALGEFVRRLHEEHGVVFHLEQTAERIERDAVTLKSGERLAAELVVIGVGVRPRVALAEAAGLAMDRGVMVNEFLETSASGIYAAGDIARWPDPHGGERIRVEHWVVAERQGQTAARNMAAGPGGRRVPFDSVPFFWSAHYDVSINYVGHAEQVTRVEVDGDPAARDVAVRFEEQGRVRALATIFRDHESLEVEREMEQQR